MSFVIRYRGGEIACDSHSQARALLELLAPRVRGSLYAVRLSDGAVLSYLPRSRVVGAPGGVLTGATVSRDERAEKRALTAEIRGLV